MPSLKLSNPFRRADGRPSLKDRAAALKASAARVVRRPKDSALEADVDWSRPPAGFIAHPRDKPFGFVSVSDVIHTEACKLLDLALAEYKRRCGLLEADLGEDERADRRQTLRQALRLDALVAATDAGVGLPLHSHQVEPGVVPDVATIALPEMRALYDVADLIHNLCHALKCQPRCRNDQGGDKPAGAFAGHILEQCVRLMEACEVEAERRRPASSWEAEERLCILARTVIENGDAAQTAAFARDVQAAVA